MAHLLSAAILTRNASAAYAAATVARSRPVTAASSPGAQHARAASAAARAAGSSATAFAAAARARVFGVSAAVFARAFATDGAAQHSHDHAHPHHECDDIDSRDTRTRVPDACWSCMYLSGCASRFCSKCGKIQPPASTNYFDLLSTDITYDLDLQQLDRKFKDLQRQLHPDHFTQRSPKEQEFSAAQSSVLNQAYATLKDPLLRANYILRMKGIDMEDDSKQHDVDPELLMQVLEVREALEDSDEKRAAELGRANRREMQSTIAALRTAFRTGDLAAAKRLTTKLQYQVRIDEDVKGRIKTVL